MIGAFIGYAIGRKSKCGRNNMAVFITVIEFIVMLSALPLVDNHNPVIFEWLGFGHDRIFFQLDGFRYVYGVITSLMWMCTTIFSEEYFAHYRNRNRYYFFMLMTFGATMGVFLSGDLLTTFTFFEVMSFTSYVMVLHDEKPGAILASKTYMAVAVIGGLVMLMGLFLLYNTVGTLEIGLLHEACSALKDKTMLYIAGVLMLFGFGGKAGMYPLHVWLPNAHPVAPAPASALLSGVLTKTGVYGILVISSQILFGDKNWGIFLLIIGVITMFTGAVLAVFSIDLKRTLACSSMSQIGFILTGTAMQCILLAKGDTEHYHFMAVYGSILHMVNHSLIKLVLFMSAGVVYMNLHKLDLNEIRGFGYRKPLLKFIFGMGVLAIIGMPLWSGYISKTLIHESIVEQIWYILEYTPEARFFQVVESIFTLTGGLTTAYMTKIYIAVFWEKNPYHQDKMDESNKKYMKPVNGIMLLLCSLILPVLGMRPQLMNNIADFGRVFLNGHAPDHNVEFFAWANLRGAVASLSIGAIVYIFFIRGCLMQRDENGKRIYIDAWPKPLNIENKIYRPLLLIWLPFIGAFFARLIGSVTETVATVWIKFFGLVRRQHARDVAYIEGGNFIGDFRALYERSSKFLDSTVSKYSNRQEKFVPPTEIPLIDRSIEKYEERMEKKKKQHEKESVFLRVRSAIKGTPAYSFVLFAAGIAIGILYILFR